MEFTILQPREGSGCNSVRVTTCTAPDGSTFKGQVSNYDGTDHFTGRVTWADGRTFEGQVNELGQPVKGRMTNPNGSRYDGTFNCWGEDEGRLDYANGDIFVGKFMNFVPTDGVITYAPRSVSMVNGKEVDTGEKVEPAQKWQWDMGYY